MDERGIVRGTGEDGRDDVLPAWREGAGVQLSAGKAEGAHGRGEAVVGSVYGGAEDVAGVPAGVRGVGGVACGCAGGGEGAGGYAVPCAERGVHPPGRRGVGMERVQLCGGEPGQGGGWEVELSWETADYSRKAGAGDAVYVGYFYEGMGRTPGLVCAEGARREDCRARVAVPDGGMPEGTALHLYLFFGNKAGTRFSPSVYVAT